MLVQAREGLNVLVSGPQDLRAALVLVHAGDVANVLGYALHRPDAPTHERLLAGVAAKSCLVQTLEDIVLLFRRESGEDDDECVSRGGRH